MQVVVMDRPRHEDLIRNLKDMGISPVLIGDGDIAAALTLQILIQKLIC